MIDLSYKIVAFLVTLGVLVVFHELGHYLVARWCGVKVLRFSVGFGRIVASRRVGPDQTEWALSAIPLGGYVKMADEREGDVAPADLDRAFNRQNVWKRIAIVAAGPIANLLLAVVLYAGTYMAGIPGQRALLAEPSAATAAAAAGLRGGDLVVALDGVAVHSWQDLRWRLLRAQDRGNVDVAVLPKDARADDAPVVRRLSLQGVKAADWEGNAISMLGLRPDLGAPLIGEVVTGKPAAAAGLEKGDRILAIDGVQMHSPGDVAQATNASAGTPLTFRVERGGSTVDIALTPEAAEQGGKTIGLAGLRLSVDPTEAKQAGGDRALRRSRRIRAGRAQDVGALGIHAENARAHRCRRGVGEEHQRSIDARRFCGPVCPGGSPRLRRLSRFDQHQSRRAQSVAGSASGWGAFAVLFRRSRQRQSRLRPGFRGRPAHRHGDARRTDGPRTLQ